MIRGSVCPLKRVRLSKPSGNQSLPNTLSASPLVGFKRRSEARKVHLKDLSIRHSLTPAKSDNADRMSSLKDVCSGLPLDPLPPNQGRDPSVPHAPVRAPNLTAEEERVREATALFRGLNVAKSFRKAVKSQMFFSITGNAVKRALQGLSCVGVQFCFNW